MVALIVISSVFIIVMIKNNSSIADDDVTKSGSTSLIRSENDEESSKDSDSQWQSVYQKFMEQEKEDCIYVSGEFRYSYISLNGFEFPLLLLKDDWNMYLFYIDFGVVLPATDKDGDILPLHRMDNAFNLNNRLYLYGACGSPMAFYYCEIVYDSVFSIEYFAEGYCDLDGNEKYHDTEGNDVDESVYNQAINDRIGDSEPIQFIG